MKPSTPSSKEAKRNDKRLPPDPGAEAFETSSNAITALSTFRVVRIDLPIPEVEIPMIWDSR